MSYEKEKAETIKEYGSLKSDSGFEILNIIGQIEGHFTSNDQSKTTKYEHIIPLIIQMDQDENVKGIMIIINTVGGDVEAGLALAEIIATIDKPTVSVVIGGGHSIGVPIAVAAKKSFIVPSATMTIHPVRTNGVVIGVPQSFDNFERMQKRITNFVVSHSNIKENRFNELLRNIGELVTDVGTTIDGKQAVEEGIIDAVGGISDAIRELKKMSDKDWLYVY